MNSGRSLRCLALLLSLSFLSVASCGRLPDFGSDFEQDRDLDRIHWECRTLLRLSPLHATSGARSLEIRFHPAPEGVPDNYPGITYEGFAPRWSGHRTIGFDVYNPESSPVPLVLRIDDREYPPYTDRFNRAIDLPTGASRIRIPLDELATSGSGRKLDPDRIRAVVLFLENPKERHTLYMDRLRLE